MFNQWTGIGNLGADPELKYTQGGTAVCNFSMATERSYKDKEGGTKKETEWVKVVAWARTAEVVKQYCAKGSKIFVQGRLQTRKWQDRDGKDRFTTEVVAEQVKFLGGKSGEGKSSGQNSDGPPPSEEAPF